LINELTTKRRTILEGTGRRRLRRVEGFGDGGGLHAIKIIDELHSEHQKNDHDGGQVAKFVAASQARHGAVAGTKNYLQTPVKICQKNYGGWDADLICRAGMGWMKNQIRGGLHALTVNCKAQ